MKKFGLGIALLAALSMAMPAQAIAGERDTYREYHERNRDNTGAILGAAVVGIIVGSVLSNDNDRVYRSRHHRSYERRGYQYRNGYYYGRDGYYYQDRYYRNSNRHSNRHNNRYRRHGR